MYGTETNRTRMAALDEDTDTTSLHVLATALLKHETIFCCQKPKQKQTEPEAVTSYLPILNLEHKIAKSL